MRALDLSNDQKPDRPDEKERSEWGRQGQQGEGPARTHPSLPAPLPACALAVLGCGGRVFEWGVPRVWLRNEDMPGLAMARSFGDQARAGEGGGQSLAAGTLVVRRLPRSPPTGRRVGRRLRRARALRGVAGRKRPIRHMGVRRVRAPWQWRMRGEEWASSPPAAP